MAHTGGPQRGYLSYGVEKTSSLTDLHADVEHLAGGEKGEDFMDERVCVHAIFLPTPWESIQ